MQNDNIKKRLKNKDMCLILFITFVIKYNRKYLIFLKKIIDTKDSTIKFSIFSTNRYAFHL